jgi:hypothetical protein
MSKQLRFSRWRRLTGWHRINEKKLPTHRTEEQRLTLYLPGALLDQAELLAAHARAASIQLYCEALLSQAIEAETARVRGMTSQVANDAFETIDEMADDAPTMREWSTATTIDISAVRIPLSPPAATTESAAGRTVGSDSSETGKPTK